MTTGREADAPTRVAFVNPSSGAGEGDEDPCVAVLRRHGFTIDESDDPEGFEERIRKVIADGAEIVAAVGGDGTHRTVAATVAGSSATYLPAPGGTFNHFPKDVGLTGADSLEDALRNGVTVEIPIAQLNGAPFINTAVIGWYPEMVRTRERLRERWPRPVAALAAVARHVPHLHRFRVNIAGHRDTAWLVWVGNGVYGTDLTELAQRDDVTERSLDVRVAWAASRFPRLRLLWNLLRRRARDPSLLDRYVISDPIIITVNRHHVDAALDAEVMTVYPPLRFTPCARTVRVLTVPGGPPRNDPGSRSV